MQFDTLSVKMSTFRQASTDARGNNSNHHLMADNFRGVQELSGRVVKRNFVLEVFPLFHMSCKISIEYSVCV